MDEQRDYFPHLKYPETWTRDANTVRRLDPDSPGPLFHLLEHDTMREMIEPWLDGRRYRYALTMFFGRAVPAPDNDVEAARLVHGPKRLIQFSSQERDFRKFASEFYAAVRYALVLERKRVGLLQQYKAWKLRKDSSPGGPSQW